jgi:hypothetical protein
MEVIQVVTVLDGLAAVSSGVDALVIGVQTLLAMLLVAVHVIYVVIVLDRLAPVARQVLVILFRDVHGHVRSLLA